MEDITRLAVRLSKEKEDLITNYKNKVANEYPNIYNMLSNANKTVAMDFGYDVVANYKIILDEYKKNDSISPILLDIIKDKLKEEHKKITQLQESMAKTLGYTDPDLVSISRMLNDLKISKEILNEKDMPPGFEMFLNEIEKITIQHDELINIPHTKIPETYDENFLKMSPNEIDKYNKDLMQFIQNINQNTTNSSQKTPIHLRNIMEKELLQ